MAGKKRRFKILFIVQGEGRGHLSQALALREILCSANHSIVKVLVGKSRQRVIPDYFFEKINVPVSRFESPNFIWDENNRSLNYYKTIFCNLKNLRIYLAGLKQIHQTVKTTKPDIILNFYEPLAGLYGILYSPPVPIICIGHQYLFLHRSFQFPPRFIVKKNMAKVFTKVTSGGAKKILALSFYPLEVDAKRNICVMPPLMREEIIALRGNEQQDFFLVYLLNAGYGDDIIEWHKHHPEIKLHCFWDKSDAPETLDHNPNLTFHRIHDKKFITLMSHCRAVISTAGFESICEACFLTKPVFVVPVGEHVDHLLNAFDLHGNAGLGISSAGFDLDKFIDMSQTFNPDYDVFRDWVSQGEKKFLQEIISVLT